MRTESCIENIIHNQLLACLIGCDLSLWSVCFGHFTCTRTKKAFRIPLMKTRAAKRERMARIARTDMRWLASLELWERPVVRRFRQQVQVCKLYTWNETFSFVRPMNSIDSSWFQSTSGGRCFRHQVSNRWCAWRAEEQQFQWSRAAWHAGTNFVRLKRSQTILKNMRISTWQLEQIIDIIGQSLKILKTCHKTTWCYTGHHLKGGPPKPPSMKNVQLKIAEEGSRPNGVVRWYWTQKKIVKFEIEMPCCWLKRFRNLAPVVKIFTQLSKYVFC